MLICNPSTDVDGDKLFYINCSLDATVVQAKEHFQSVSQIPVAQQQLRFKGHEMIGYYSLTQYEVNRDSVIDLVVL